jgi:hypothetical protein
MTMTPINLCKKVWAKVYDPHSAYPDIEIDYLFSVLVHALVKEPTNPEHYALVAVALQSGIQPCSLTESWVLAPGVVPPRGADTQARRAMTTAVHALIQTGALTLDGVSLKQGPNFRLEGVLET